MEGKSACENRLRMLGMTAGHKATGHVHQHAPLTPHTACTLRTARILRTVCISRTPHTLRTHAHYAPTHITHTTQPHTLRSYAHHTPHIAMHTTQPRTLCTHAHHTPTQSLLCPLAWAGLLPRLEPQSGLGGRPSPSSPVHLGISSDMPLTQKTDLHGGLSGPETSCT